MDPWEKFPNKNFRTWKFLQLWRPVSKPHSVLEALLKPLFKIKTNFSWDFLENIFIHTEAPIKLGLENWRFMLMQLLSSPVMTQQKLRQILKEVGFLQSLNWKRLFLYFLYSFQSIWSYFLDAKQVYWLLTTPEIAAKFLPMNLHDLYFYFIWVAQLSSCNSKNESLTCNSKHCDTESIVGKYSVSRWIDEFFHLHSDLISEKVQFGLILKGITPSLESTQWYFTSSYFPSLLGFTRILNLPQWDSSPPHSVISETFLAQNKTA